MPQTAEYIAHCFRHFATMCDGRSRLYAALSPRIADDEPVFSLAYLGEQGQSPVNLLFGAVHYLLLGGAQHPLAEYYPSVGGRRPPDRAYPEFADFCRQFEPQIVDLVATQRVQTNEVGRCGLLLPAFALAWEHVDRQPLSLIEVGASAGLNLLFDHYRYEYADGHVCGPHSAARIRTELRGEVACPLPEVMPRLTGRVGIDVAPVDVTDADSIRWVESLIWADQLHRIELFRHAVALAREHPPCVITGDGLEAVPGIVGQVPEDARPCVFHSHATYQADKTWRREFDQMLAGLGACRDLVHISLEWLGDDPGPQLHLTVHAKGERRTAHLADCDHHGGWMRWLADRPITMPERRTSP
jgi:hypothetical protein